MNVVMKHRALFVLLCFTYFIKNIFWFDLTADREEANTRPRNFFFIKTNSTLYHSKHNEL